MILSKTQSSSHKLRAGDFFGETTLISGGRTFESAKAVQETLLIETPRRTMLKLIEQANVLQSELHHRATEHLLQSYFGGSLPKEDLKYLVANAIQLSFAIGDVLFEEGDKEKCLLLIKKGTVAISGIDAISKTVSAGGFVGEDELFFDDVSQYKVEALSHTEMVKIGNLQIKEVLSHNRSLRKYINDRFLASLREKTLGLSSDKLTEYDAYKAVQFEREKPFFNTSVRDATDVLLIDQTRCIGCDGCEDACAEIHEGISRLVRKAGSTQGNMHIPNACRHCEHPYCNKDCPPNAIHRSINGEIFINDRCIGCGNCEKNCPYGAIQMVPIHTEYQKPGVMKIIADIVFGPTSRRFLTETKGVKKAVKCDLCNGVREGPACVRACPTGAAIRVRIDQ